MMFDALNLLAHAASEAAGPQVQASESPREPGSAPSSTSNDSASTMTFSPQLKHQVLERECPPERHLREVVEDQQAIAEEDEAMECAPSSPGRGGAGCTEYECGYCGERKVSTSTGGDGRVRIRCECGGKHGDLKARMHAKWTLVEATVGKISHSRRSRRRQTPWEESDADTAETR